MSAWICSGVLGGGDCHRRSERNKATNPTTSAARTTPHQIQSPALMRRGYARPRCRAIMGVRVERTEGPVAHAKDKGEKHSKKMAQKSIKEKRAEKKAKKQASAPRPE